MRASAVLATMASRLAGGLIRHLHYHFFDRHYDKVHGVDTNGVSQPDELSLLTNNARFAQEYTPTPTHVFRRALSTLEVDFRQFVFVDLGSGKGRMLLLAAEWPFLRIEGVEFASELHQIAKRNVAVFASRRPSGPHIVVRHEDAAEYTIPEDPCIFYLYNPFGEPVLARILDNIEASFERNPRPIYFIYVNPKQRHILDQKSFVRPIVRPWRARVLDRLTSPEPLAFYQAPGVLH
jgi:SAM-dependent methyltransferase